MAHDFLETMAEASRRRVQDAKRNEGLVELRDRALTTPPAPRLRLGHVGFNIIAEIKLSAPSTGQLAGVETDIAGRANEYADAGASAVSVLTEPERFGGCLEHLARASVALRDAGVPAMRKDFLVDPYQVWEARAAGAGGVLLILQLLDDKSLTQMLEAAQEAGLFVLLEAFDLADLERSRVFAPTPGLLMGLNCRDLRTLGVEPGRFAELADSFPDGPPRVAESGLESPDDVAGIAELGYEMALVGSALMRSEDPAALLVAMLDAGRGVHT